MLLIKILNRFFLLFRLFEYFLIKLSIKMVGKYEIQRVNRGGGPLHKYKLRNLYTGKVYFVKKGSRIIDVWQCCLLRLINSPYRSLKFSDTARRIRSLRDTGVLKEHGAYVLVGEWVSVYKYYSSLPICPEAERVYILQKLFEKGFAHLDPSEENFASINGKCTMLDIESIVPLSELRESISSYVKRLGLATESKGL